MEKEPAKKSKTQIKKEAEERQRLGEELIKFSSRQLKRMDLPHELRDALIEAGSIKSNIAGRRQRQFIGALMRDVDPDPIRRLLLNADANEPVEPEMDQEIQMQLDRLLTNDPAIVEEFISSRPGLDRQRLKQLLRNISKEKTTGKPSKSLKALRQLIVESMDPA